MSHLLLGPIIGHTDHESSIVWVRVQDDPSDYDLRVHTRGVFPFISTEVGEPEFGTAVARADGLHPEWQYRYHILRHGRRVPGSQGTFRTMPSPGAMADVVFVSLSCSHGKDKGAWLLLSRYVKNAHPRFLVMMGDQVYLDSSDEVADATWPQYLDADSGSRRQAIAAKYQEHWSREPIRMILANTPTYMMWDDHEIRNGWGSFAPDSPTLATQYPRGAKITDQYTAYFEDARELFWHFQACRNPPPPAGLAFPSQGMRRGVPFFFQCGRLLVLVLDDRGARDVWRADHPVLGDEQWTFITDVFAALPSDIDALALVVPLPLTSMSPTGKAQSMLGDRTDDIELFKRGDARGLLEFGNKSLFSSLAFNRYGLASGGPPIFGDLANTKLSLLTDIRDNWANHLCTVEQAELIRALGSASRANRPASGPRSFVLIGGDLHAGGIFDLTVSEPTYSATSVVTSGISKDTTASEGIVGVLMDDDFEIADGIRARLQQFTHAYNFGVTQVVFGGGAASISNALAHEGSNQYWTLKLP